MEGQIVYRILPNRNKWSKNFDGRSHDRGAPPPHKKCTFPWGIWAPTQYMVPWANPSPHPKRHLDWFSRFCRTCGCPTARDKQTGTHTHRPLYICSDSMHLCSPCMQSGLIMTTGHLDILTKSCPSPRAVNKTPTLTAPHAMSRMVQDARTLYITELYLSRPG